MSPMQQIFLGLGAVAKKTYVDDVFSTQAYIGTGTTHTINNGIDLSGEGGLTWTKSRFGTQMHGFIDTLRGVQKVIASEGNSAEFTEPTSITAFNNNGYTMGGETHWNASTGDFVSWTFRKAPGFFDCVTYTGNGSSRTIAHSLGCQPGRIIIKCTSKTGDWLVNDYAMDNNGNLWAKLNENGQYLGAGQYTGSTGPTSTSFTLGTANEVNESGETFVAYIFAGGDRTGNASVEFQGKDGYLEFKDTSDWLFTGQFCIEYWVYVTDNSVSFPTVTWGSGAYRAIFWTGSAWNFEWPDGNDNITLNGSAPTNTWKHHVITKDSNNRIRFFIDGELISSGVKSANQGANELLFLGYKANVPNSGFKNGKLSNVRIVNGSIPTTYQTSSTTNGASIFTSPTAPLTKTSQGATSGDVKLICCNDIGASQATYINDSPGITNYGDIGAEGSTESPFSSTLDASAVFGENEDKPVIRMGQYMGSGSATAGNTVDIGFEPSYVMIKRSGGTGSWAVFDVMRGIVSAGDDPVLQPDVNDAEYTTTQYLDLTPRGFRLKGSFNQTNADENGYVYVAIRRPDGYVGKPRTATELFAIDTGNSSATIPAMDSGFPVDFALVKQPASSSDWWVYGRLMQGRYLVANGTNAGGVSAAGMFDSNLGFYQGSSYNSNYQSWMWKRHAGFDVVCFEGDGVAGKQIPHSLSKTPEMIWIKNRDRNDHWRVGHKGLNGGTNPWQYQFKINDRGADSASTFLNNTAPTSTHFTVGSDSGVNHDGEDIMVLLFATTDVSYVGSYSGGSGSSVTVTIGFQPRFLWAKNISEAATNDTNAVFVLDTSRGWASGNDQKLDMSSSNTQSNSEDFGAPTSTGFTLNANTDMNNGGDQYVFYAHA